MKNVWNQSGNSYLIREVSQQVEQLPVGIYKFQVDMYENPFLSHIQEQFVFPYKIYGVERPFIERVKKSYAQTTGNFGVMLNGMKGTGKTVTAELLCNELELPVIIISFHHKNLISFLNDIQQDVIIFIDEFEKIYDGYDNSLLSIMDGALKTKHRLFFMLTTNELRVDRNLLQRPSRVRYVKTFSDMSLEVIMEVVDDLLVHKHWRDQAVKVISELPIITMDLIKSIIQEVNIHNEDPHDFRDVFNIHSDRDDLYNVYEMQNGEKTEAATYCSVSPSYIMPQYSLQQDFRINGKFQGTIVNVVSPSQIVVQKYENVRLDDGQYEEQEISRIYVLEKANKTHSAFSNMVI